MCCPRWQALPGLRVLDFLCPPERTRG